MEIKENQKPQKTEALEIIKKLNLMDLLSQFGEAKTMGSLVLGTLLKPDIDIHLLLGKQKRIKETANKICNTISKFPNIKNVITKTYKNSNAIKVDAKYTSKFFTWDIEIWISNKIEETAFINTANILKKITDDDRKIIMQLKEYYHKNNLKQPGLSTKIYYAVLEENVKTREEFEKLIDSKLKADPNWDPHFT